MENDIQLKNKENLINTQNYFCLDFTGQKLERNKLFEAFKKQQLDEYGKDAKLFYCKKDNLYFYVTKDNCKTLPYYYKQCPLCHNYICYFCKRNAQEKIGENGNCCIKLRIYYLFFHNGFQFFRGLEHIKSNQRDNFIFGSIVSFIPLLSFIALNNSIYFELFRYLLLKDKEWFFDINSLERKNYDCYLNRSFYFRKKKYCLNINNIIDAIIIANSILFSISYTIYDFYLKLCLIIISLFSKFYPWKYYIGIIYND